MNNTIFLCGFMGCGKTAVGKALAAQRHAPLIDLDSYITEQQHSSIPLLFETLGEDGFRKLERAALRTICTQQEGVILACGGGALVHPATAAMANTYGRIVLLDVPFSVCFGRIAGDENRPLTVNASRKNLKELYDARRPLYLAAASEVIVPLPRETPKEIAERIQTK